MSFIRISESINNIATKLIEVVNAHLEYYQVVAFDKVISLLNKMLSTAIAGMTAFLFLFFSSFALAHYLGEIMFHSSAGFLVVAILYALGGIVVYKNRVKWIIDPMVEALSELVEETTDDLGLESTQTKEDTHEE